MKIQFTEHKGSKLAVFHDVNNSECSFQGDKHEGHDLIWLGVNIGTNGQPAFRMLLDKARAAVIAEILKHFLETGNVPSLPEEMPGSIRQKSKEEIKENEKVAI